MKRELVVRLKDDNYSIRESCSALGFSRSSIYETARSETRRAVAEAPVVKAMKEVHKHRYRRFYGSPRMATELCKQGIEMTRHRAARLMRKYVIRAKSHRRFVKTTDSTHTDPIAANLLGRDFRAGEGNKIWCADITYLRTSTGPIYLAAVLDIRTRKWVGYSVAKHMDTSLVNSALDMALLQESKMPEMMHTDRGSQYASASHRARLKKNGITLSMSGKGECWDNAAMESFFGTFKTEVGNVFIDEDDARASIFDFQAFYNHERLHSALNNQSPIVFERQLKKQLLN